MLSERQKEIVTGSLLGDGTIWTNFVDSLMKLQFSQSQQDYRGKSKRQYLCWFVFEFMDFGCSVRPKKVKAEGLIKEIVGEKEYQQYVFTTKCHQLWNVLESKWYVPRTDHKWYKRRKIVPQDLKLTPLTLCIWHMDDGSNNPKDANIELNTQSFTVEEVEFLIERLHKDLNIESHKKKGGHKDGQYKIYIGRKSYFDFIEIIKPHIAWDCFKYKVDTSAYTKKPHRGETHSGAKLTEKKVKQIFQLRDEGLLQKDIAEKIGTNKASVSLILSGDRWQHLGMNRPTKKKPRLTEEIKNRILALNSKGLLQKEIAERLNINQSTISRVLKETQCHALN